MWAALFPGQGSQQIGMGKFLFENFMPARESFEEASDVLKLNFKKLCFDGPDADLALTENTQPALLLVSTATYRCLNSIVKFEAKAGAGHSVGEYAALVAAQALTFSEALQAVRIRGQEMQKAVPVGQGAMLVVLGLSDERVVQLCQWAEKKSGAAPLEPANFNSPGQVVISGSVRAVEWLKSNVASANNEIFAGEASKIRLIPLNVSAPFHCSLMKPAEKVMEMVLNETTFSTARWPIVQNFTAQESVAADVLRKNLISQISGSVRWTQCFQRLGALGVKNAVGACWPCATAASPMRACWCSRRKATARKT